MDVWREFVEKQGNIEKTLDGQYLELYGQDDLKTLKDDAKVGDTYHMILQVSSTCPTKVEIGFSDHGGWMKSHAPGNSEYAIISATDEWKKVDDLRLESRTACSGKSLTIHRVQMVHGRKSCLQGISFNYLT